jgi:hypothetical protein
MAAERVSCHKLGTGQGTRLARDFWCSGAYDNVEILDHSSLEKQLLYVWTQGVRDGLVEHPSQYPGVWFGPDDLGTTRVYRKPEGAFFGGLRPQHLAPTDQVSFERWQAEREREERERLAAAYRRRMETARNRGRPTKRQRKLEDQRERRRLAALQRESETPRRDRSNLPEQVTLTISVPPGYEDWPIEDVRAHFRALLDAEVARLHAERAANGETTYIGVDRILSQDPRESAGCTWPTFARNPRIACSDWPTRLAALKALRAWRAEMREKRRAWLHGNRDVVFPRGCYGLWRLHDAHVQGGRRLHAPPADAPTRAAPS